MQWVELNWLEDAEILGRLGRKALAAIFDLLVPCLVQQNITLPDPGLLDRRYFAELAGLFRSQPIKVAVYLPPFLAAASLSPAEEPRPEEATIARKVFELLTALDSDDRLRKAPLIKVFNLYYRQRLQPAEIARLCHCSRALIFKRLATIRNKVYWSPQQLRDVSPQVEAMQEALTDYRAKGIYRKGAAFGEEDGDQGED